MNELFYQYRKQIFSLVAVCVLLIIGVAIWQYINSFQYVTFKFDPQEATTAVLYDGTNGTDPSAIAPTNTKAIPKIDAGKKYRLKKGNYFVQFSGSTIAQQMKGFILADTPSTQSFTFSYTSDYLGELLASQKSSIENVIIAKYPKLPSLYDFSSEALYEKGDWYAAALVYKGPDSLSRDTLRIIAHKVNGTWQVASEPQIVISSVDNPGVPMDVINAINTIDNQTPLMPDFNLYTNPYNVDGEN